MAAGRTGRTGTSGMLVAFLVYSFILTFLDTGPPLQINYICDKRDFSTPIVRNYNQGIRLYGKNAVINAFIYLGQHKTQKPYQAKCHTSNLFIITLCLLLSGDVHQCPGPISSVVDGAMWPSVNQPGLATAFDVRVQQVGECRDLAGGPVDRKHSVPSLDCCLHAGESTPSRWMSHALLCGSRRVVGVGSVRRLRRRERVGNTWQLLLQMRINKGARWLQ